MADAPRKKLGACRHSPHTPWLAEAAHAQAHPSLPPYLHTAHAHARSSNMHKNTGTHIQKPLRHADTSTDIQPVSSHVWTSLDTHALTHICACRRAHPHAGVCTQTRSYLGGICPLCEVHPWGPIWTVMQQPRCVCMLGCPASSIRWVGRPHIK